MLGKDVIKQKICRNSHFLITIALVSFLIVNHIEISGKEEDGNNDKVKEMEKGQKQITTSFVKNNSNIINNATLALTDYNFIAAGDWYCNDETKKTIDNILNAHPELIASNSAPISTSRPSTACRFSSLGPKRTML